MCFKYLKGSAVVFMQLEARTELSIEANFPKPRLRFFY